MWYLGHSATAAQTPSAATGAGLTRLVRWNGTRGLRCGQLRGNVDPAAADGVVPAVPHGSDGPAIATRDRVATPSSTHLVLIPSYNSGQLLERTVQAARCYWSPVWVLIDGSTDGSAAAVEAMARSDPALRVLYLLRNGGKGAAVRHGLMMAEAIGFTHALVMDADGQHPAGRIPDFMASSATALDALVMGWPVFGPDAPWIRIVWRRLSNAAAAVVTQRAVGDTLFGFRVYPIRPLLHAMQASRGMRRFDFDPEAVVRLAWNGVPLVHLPAQVRYLSPAEDGVSHFRYVRDNWLLIRMYCRLATLGVLRACRMLSSRSRRHAVRSRQPAGR